ncbi:hypothetical protein VE01_01833 [Pseudogymnoascus verrucosus]|uniref:Zn(2)-C6 fungal-type domain-containing protein n=1 Tax=Pseudogymnoascus verrucosus TaxID=342668 RepID=A0A1B8GW86_9PEZI|nr:uncharacterized protein VE01_01833 [Pseudogymnoascus verrucosus]OBU00095.2 hypothetical protein VE01_01833 [Pseudogymnoascus verrucosus]
MPHPDHSTSPAQTRTRQGCLTCRKRRRKCDEQKPRCQNCTGRSIVCRYGVKLTFLATNRFNLVPEDAQALRETTPSKYGHIRFIDGLDDTEGAISDDHERHNAVPSFEISPHSLPGTPDTEHSRTAQRVPESTVSVLRQPQSRFPEHYYHGEDSGIGESQGMGEGSNDDERHHQAPVVYPPVIDQSHSYEMPTGDAEDNVQLADEADYDRLVSEPLPSRRPLPVASLSPRHSTNAGYGKSWLPPLRTVSETFESATLREEPSQLQVLSNDKRNQLLKFYVDEVAQWLDICTPKSSFGIHIPILARDYTPLLNSVLALAAQQQSLFLPPDSDEASQSAELATLATASIGLDIYSSRDEAVATCTLLMISELLSTQIQNWKRVLKGRIDFLGPLGIDGFSDGHHSSTSWVTLRLDLALAIFSGSPLMTPIEKWHPVSMPFSDDMNIMSLEQSRAPEWTRRSILLCSQAAQLCFSTEISNITTSHSATDTWTYLWSSTRGWLESLPSSMYPIFTSPISAIPSTPPYFFPLILYTSRSNMYAAIMHHTASVLLLQSKPPTVRPSSHLKTPTWHAVQICGICIGNNAQWSYDPTILAALIYAGRLISYQEQKKELLDVLRVLVKGSGWQVGGAIDEMIEWWRVDGGFHVTPLESPFPTT